QISRLRRGSRRPSNATGMGEAVTGTSAARGIVERRKKRGAGAEWRAGPTDSRSVDGVTARGMGTGRDRRAFARRAAGGDTKKTRCASDSIAGVGLGGTGVGDGIG